MVFIKCLYCLKHSMPLINGRYYCCFSSFLPDVYLYTCICFPTHKRQGVCLIYLCSPAPRRLTRQRRDSRNCLVKEQTSVFTSCWHQPQNAFRVQDSIHLSWEKARRLTFHRSGGKRILEAVPMQNHMEIPWGRKFSQKPEAQIAFAQLAVHLERTLEPCHSFYRLGEQGPERGEAI